MKKGMYYQRSVITVAAIFGVLLVGSIVFSLLWDGGSNPGKTSGKKAESSVTDFDPDAFPEGGSAQGKSSDSIVTAGAVNAHTGIITSFGDGLATMTVSEIGTGAEITGALSGATDITNSFGKKTTAAMLRVGDIVNIGIGADAAFTYVNASTDTWTYKGIFNLVIDTELKKITISDMIYRYDDSMKILLDGEFVDLSQLSRLDVFDVCGIGNYIYLIRVASGHGWLQLTGIDAYVGGSLSIDGDEFSMITEDQAPYILSEGSHRIEITNVGLHVSDTIQIMSGQTTFYDLLPYSPEPEKYCLVTFQIEPFGAILSVDGQQMSYDEPISLSYGEHEAFITMTSYKSYLGTFTLSSDSTVFSVALSYEGSPYRPETTTDETSGAGDSQGTGADQSAGSRTGSQTTGSQTGSETTGAGDSQGTGAGQSAGSQTAGSQTTGSQTGSETDTVLSSFFVSSSTNYLVITGTEGCAVFVENKYQGVLENRTLIIPKPLGTVHIRLTLEGYVTSSFTVTLEDNGENHFLDLPEMTPLE